jgi:hypothetical protein
MVFRKLRIVTVVLIVAIVLSCVSVALVRKFVFPSPHHENEPTGQSQTEVPPSGETRNELS